MTTSNSRQALILIAACVAALGGCTTRGAAMSNGNMAQRAEDQVALNAASAIKPETDDRATHLRLIAQMQQKSLYFASLAHIDAYEQKWGATPDSSILRADALRQTVQPEAAKALYTQLLTTPQKAHAAHGLGLLAGRAGDLSAATAYFNQASAASPTNADVLNDLGYVLLQQGKWSEARLPLMKASELDSSNPRVWSNIALYLTLEGQSAQAKALMDERKLSDGARAEIAEQARGIQQKAVPAASKAATAVPPAAVAAPAPVVVVPAAVAAAPVAPAPTAVAAPQVSPSGAVVRTIVVAPPLPPAPALPAAPVAAQPAPVAVPSTDVTTAPVVARSIGVAELNALPAAAGQDIAR